MSPRSASLLSVLLTVAVAVPSSGSGRSGLASRVRLERFSQRSFDETVEQLEWGFGGYGISVLSRMDYPSVIRSPERHPRRSRSLTFLKQSWVETVLEHAPEAALDLPLRIHVFERDDGRIVVSYYRPAAILGAHDREALRELGASIDAALDSIVHVATKSD